jgi:TolA-binding protein
MADDALFWIAECRFARGLYRDAIFEYRDMIELHPGSHRVPRAWYMIALSYERLGETAAMNDNLAIVVERFPDSDVAPLARDRLGSL